MDWVTIIIVVISVGVWALANLANTNKKPPQVGQGGNAMARNRPSASEIDRFLEEVNRRKQQQQERRATAPPPPKKELKRPVAVEHRAAPAPKVTQRQAITSEPVVQSLTSIPPTPATAPIVSLATLSSIQVPPTPRISSMETPHVKQAKALLKSQQGLQTIFVINEILGPPRCRKPPGKSA